MKFPFTITKLIVSLIFVVFCSTIHANSIFDEPIPKRFVNDYAGLLTETQIDLLEQKVKAIEEKTTMQIAIVTVKGLEGMKPSSFTHKLANLWGVGQMYKNNGILIMVKPKYPHEKGEVYIAIGEGLEETISNSKAQKIVNNNFIPNFKKGEIYSGIDEGIDSIIAYSSKKRTQEQISAFYLPQLLYFILLSLIILPFAYIIYLKNRHVSEEYNHFFIKGAYNSQNVIAQVELMEKRYKKKYFKFKKMIKRYENISKNNLLKYSGKIDNQMFCYLLDDQNRMKMFWKMADPFMLAIFAYLITIAAIINYIIYVYHGSVVLGFTLFATILIIFFMLGLLNSFFEMYQYVLRKNSKYLGGISVALFAFNALLKRDVKRTYNHSTNTYTYRPHYILFSGTSTGGSFGGGGYSGGGFGGGSFGGGGAGGSW